MEATFGALTPILDFPVQRGMDILERVEQRATKMLKCLKHVDYVVRLREMTIFTLEKRGLRGVLYMCRDTRWRAVRKSEPEKRQ